jgi:hypothetical protein
MTRSVTVILLVVPDKGRARFVIEHFYGSSRFHSDVSPDSKPSAKGAQDSKTE